MRKLAIRLPWRKEPIPAYLAGEDAHKPKSTTTTFYQYRLLKTTTKFDDGTQMSLEVTDRVGQRVIRKTSQSGKRKIKVRYKTKVICRVCLSFLQKKYLLQSSANEWKVTQKDKYLCFKNKKTTAQAGDSYVPPMYLTLGSIADIYQQVQLK